jgi:hypothetical protein
LIFKIFSRETPQTTPFLAPVLKLGGGTPSQIRAWSWIRNKKTQFF